jgi:hypothetical protein
MSVLLTTSGAAGIRLASLILRQGITAMVCCPSKAIPPEFTLTDTEVIAAFPKVDSLSKLPKSDLCSHCDVEQYAMMQADAYTGVYDEEVKASYE